MKLKMDMSNYYEYMDYITQKYYKELDQLNEIIDEESNFDCNNHRYINHSVLESIFGKDYNNKLDVMFYLITESMSRLKDCSSELRKNKEFIASLALSNGVYLNDVPDEILKDSEALKWLIKECIGDNLYNVLWYFEYKSCKETELFEKLLEEYISENFDENLRNNDDYVFSKYASKIFNEPDKTFYDTLGFKATSLEIEIRCKIEYAEYLDCLEFQYSLPLADDTIYGEHIVFIELYRNIDDNYYEKYFKYDNGKIFNEKKFIEELFKVNKENIYVIITEELKNRCVKYYYKDGKVLKENTNIKRFCDYEESEFVEQTFF